MRKSLCKSFFAVLLTTVILVFVSLPHSGRQKNVPNNDQPEQQNTDVTQATQAKNSYGKIPLHFELNSKQADEQIKFISRSSSLSLFLKEDGATIALQNSKSVQNRKRTADIVQMKFVGANQSPKIYGEELLEGKTNYLIGNDPKAWRTDIPNYAKVRYEEVYDGVDLVWHGTQAQLEYDFVVKPQADYKTIAVIFDGATDICVDDNGDLLLQLKDATLRQHKPFVYQETNGEKKEISGRWSVVRKAEGEKNKSAIRNPQSAIEDSAIVKFSVGDYDKNKPLTIDPVLSYSTYLGGTLDDFGASIAVDSSGNAYVTGQTFSTTGFPLVNAYQTSFGSAASQAFVTKINAAGTAFVYSTYLGGTNGTNRGSGIAVDSNSRAYVVGMSSSTSFPTTAGSYLPSRQGLGSPAGFLVRLSAAGNSLEYGTYIASPTTFQFDGGGCCGDITDVEVGSSNNAYVLGYSNEPTFPTTAGAFRTAPPDGNGKEAFVMKFNSSGSGLVYSTFLGGSTNQTADTLGVGFSHAFSLALDSSGNAYIAGRSNSTAVPVTAAIQPVYRGQVDAVVWKLNSTGTALIYATYLGGITNNAARGIAVDSSGNAYITGISGSLGSTANQGDFPVTNSSFQPFTISNTVDGFLTKLNSSGGLIYSTYLGHGLGGAVGEKVAVDLNGNAYVFGTTFGAIFPIGSLQPARNRDAFVLKFNPQGIALAYGTYLGGAGDDVGPDIGSIAVDQSGNAYLTGLTGANDFPVTAGVPQGTFGGSGSTFGGDAFISRISPLGVECPTIAINPQPLRVAVKGQPYNQTLTASGGTPPYTFSFFPNFNASLPNGVSLSSSGIISGTPQINAVPTYYNLPVRVTDANNCIGVRPYRFLLTTGTHPYFDFDKDLRTDVAVFRPSNGVWYILNSNNNVFTGFGFGTNGDIITPGDYDGDGVTDASVFRPSIGFWFFLKSNDQSFSGFQWGTNGDIPAPGDFDGDGITDVAAFRPSNGTWYLIQSSSGISVTQLGAGGDVPTVGDYDGDGKSDISIFRPSTGVWTVIRSSNGTTTATQWGLNGDKPVVGDYDGDGKSDIAVYRPSQGVWYLLRSTAGFYAVQFGINTDIPTHSDYDGDGMTDIAVYRDGIWYILQSLSSGVRIVSFGIAGDKPIPSAAVP
jgi:hypothetical protein